MPLPAEPVKFRQFTVAGHVVILDASQRGFVLAFDDRRFVMGDRAQRAFATTVVVALHLFVLWGLIVSRPQIAHLPDTDTDVIQAEIYQPQPPPEPEVQPVLKLQLVPRPVPPPQPKQDPQPQKQAAAQAAPVPAPPAPTPAQEPAKPMPQVVNRPQDTFDTPSRQALQARADVKLQSTQAPSQTIDPELKAANLKLKKKQEEDLQAHQTLTASLPADTAGDIKLHEAPSQSIQTVVAPSGLTPDGNHLATGTPANVGGGAGALAGGKNGLKGGRGGLTQALQNDDYCLKAQRDGKPIPANCHMKSLTEMAALSMKLDPHLQKEADAHAFQQKYKTTPGNAAYWKRDSPTSNPGIRLDDDDQAGAYTSAKDQRVMTGSDPDPKDSIHKEAH